MEEADNCMHLKIFPAEIEHLYEMLEFIKNYGQFHHTPSSVLESIILAAEEALVNIISYGYPDKKQGIIEIFCEKTEPQPGIKIIIKDQGIPFDPTENMPTSPPSPSTILKKAEISPGGYGIYIISGLMDRIEYQRVEAGNILSLTKYLES